MLTEIVASTVAEARPYQERIIQKAYDAFIKTGVKTCMIESPTGSGKTVVGMLIAHWLQQEYNIGVCWVAMRRNLLSQAERANRDLNLGLDNPQYISMFDKHPPTHDSKGRRIELLVADECVPGDTLVDVEHNGELVKLSIEDVIAGKGQKALSMDTNGELSYQPIVSRTKMGIKELVEITIDTAEGEMKLLTTEEGRVWTQHGYKTPPNLLGESVLCQSSCCQTYLHEKNTTQWQTAIQSNSGREGNKCPTLRVRMRKESSLVSLHTQVQEIPIQSPPSTPQSRANTKTTGYHQRDIIGRRIGQLRKEQNGRHTNHRKATYWTLNQAARICELETQRTCTARKRYSQQTQQGLQQKFSSSNLQYHQSPRNFQISQNALCPKENGSTRISAEVNTIGNSCLVDGRWLTFQPINTFVHRKRKQINRELVIDNMGCSRICRLGQANQKTIYQIQTTQHGIDVGIGSPAHYPALLVQNRKICPETLIEGIVKGIRHIGQYVETYDIGIANNHNFFADGILIHNCQHDCASSMTTLYNTIQPKYILGLTATPFRTDSVKLCFNKVIKDAGIHALISQGYLSEYHQYTIPEYTVEHVTTHYLRDPKRWGKSVIFWHKREQADECLSILLDHGVRAELVVADNDPKLERRERQITAFEAGDIDVLVNMYILTEGFDSPSLKTVWVRDSGKAPTIQMCGRVFRKHPGIDIKQVVQSKRTRWPIQRTATPIEAQVWMGDRWASYKQNKSIDKISTLTAITMISIQTEMPKFISNRKIKNSPRLRGESGLYQRNDGPKT